MSRDSRHLARELHPDEPALRRQPGDPITLMAMALLSFVYDVLADSPGAAAGVRKGDVLLEIDGRAASTSTPIELRNLLNVDGAMRRLVLERDGQRMTVDVRLRSRL